MKFKATSILVAGEMTSSGRIYSDEVVRAAVEKFKQSGDQKYGYFLKDEPCADQGNCQCNFHSSDKGPPSHEILSCGMDGNNLYMVGESLDTETGKTLAEGLRNNKFSFTSYGTGNVVSTNGVDVVEDLVIMSFPAIDKIPDVVPQTNVEIEED